MVQKRSVSANEYRRGVFANDEEAEERGFAYEEGPKRRCWPMGSIS